MYDGTLNIVMNRVWMSHGKTVVRHDPKIEGPSTEREKTVKRFGIGDY
jgi:hypothetical protein